MSSAESPSTEAASNGAAEEASQEPGGAAVPPAANRPTELVREISSARAQVDASITVGAAALGDDGGASRAQRQQDVRGATAASALKDDQDYYDSDSDEEDASEKEKLNDIVNDMLDPIMGKDDPKRMKVNSLELESIMDIKAAIESDPELDNVSDFMIAQFGIICQQEHGSPSQRMCNALQRARGLQKYRQDFDVADTYAEGCRALKAFVELFPKHNLAWTFSQEDGTWVYAVDASKVDASIFTTEAKLRAYFAGVYYLHHACALDLATIRRGPISLVECGGVSGASFRSNFRVWLQMADRFHAYYPAHHQGKFYHTSPCFNQMISIMKKTMVPKDQADLVEVGLQSDTRLDELFLVPNVQVATERYLHNMTECLKRRYDNEKQFSIFRTSR